MIILWIYWTTSLKSRWRYLLQVLWWIFSFFILISGVFYFYPDSPDIDGFIKSRNNEIKILWINNPIDKSEAYIRIITSKGNEDFEMYPNFSKVLSENSVVSYPSLKTQRDENVVIITPHWDLVWIFPQSEIQIKFEWWDLKKVEKLNLDSYKNINHQDKIGNWQLEKSIMLPISSCWTVTEMNGRRKAGREQFVT